MSVPFSPSRTIRRAATGAVAAACLIAISTAAYADKGGKADRDADQDRDRPVSIIGVRPVTTGATTFLQFTNAGPGAGTATVTIYDQISGDELATWTSPSVPPKAALLEDLAAIAAGASPPLTTAEANNPVDLSVTSSLHGSVQTLILTGGVLSNISACGPTRHDVVGGVPGPGDATMVAAVRIGNASDTTRHATLTLYSSTDGSTLGTWTSPDVPPHGSIIISTAALAAAATPVIPVTTTSFTLAADPAGLRALVFTRPASGGAPALLNNACRLEGTDVVADEAAADAHADKTEDANEDKAADASADTAEDAHDTGSD